MSSTQSGYALVWPGVPGGPIYFSFPMKAMIVPASHTRQRPGIKAYLPRIGIQHENGNPNALAVQDSRYLYNGAGGRQASWHATVDHKEGYANLPADEVGWQAGDGAGPGNYRGFAIELSQWPKVHGTAAQWRAARRNAAEVGGRVGARLNITPPSKRHKDFMNKNCPQYLNGNPAEWAQYVEDWLHFYNDEKARMGKPVPVITLGVGGEAVTTANLNARAEPRAGAALWATIPQGRTVRVIDGPRTDPGYQWWRVEWQSGGKWVSGWVAANWLQATKSPDKPAPAPEGRPVVGDRVKVTQNLHLRVGSGTEYRIVSLLAPGTEATVIDGPRDANNHRWVDIRLDSGGTGWVADDWLEVTGKADKPKPEPKYAKPSPIPELLETSLGFNDRYNTVVAVSTVNESDFIFVADLIEFKRTSAARQYAGDGFDEVRKPFQEGERAIAAWIVQGDDGIYWYVLTGEDNEWVRAKVADTVRIADSPLLGDDSP